MQPLKKYTIGEILPFWGGLQSCISKVFGFSKKAVEITLEETEKLADHD
jgi:hypothetical protein